MQRCVPLMGFRSGRFVNILSRAYTEPMTSTFWDSHVPQQHITCEEVEPYCRVTAVWFIHALPTKSSPIFLTILVVPLWTHTMDFRMVLLSKDFHHDRKLDCWVHVGGYLGSHTPFDRPRKCGLLCPRHTSTSLCAHFAVCAILVIYGDNILPLDIYLSKTPPSASGFASSSCLEAGAKQAFRPMSEQHARS